MRTAMLLLIPILLAFGHDVEAAEPKSVLDLFTRVPDPPSTAQEAAAWFDKDGKLIHPGLLALKADLDASSKTIEASGSKAAASSQAAMTKGMESVGIDVARMKSDPAYAKEMQQQIQKMSPQEQMAFMQQMMQPHTQAQQQDTLAMTQESPAAQATVDAAKAWSVQQRAGAMFTVQNELDRVAQRAGQHPIQIKKPAIEYDSPGCDNPCLAQWKAYGEKVWPLVLDRETEILQGRSAVLQRYRTATIGLMKEGHKHLTGTQYGTGVRSQINRTYVNGYHEGLLDETRRLIDLTESAAKRAADTVNRGVEQVYMSR
jgi:hypothetical protein